MGADCASAQVLAVPRALVLGEVMARTASVASASMNGAVVSELRFHGPRSTAFGVWMFVTTSPHTRSCP